MGLIACYFKLHSWSAFLHVPSRCVDERFCKSCQKTEATLRHRWAKWEHSKQNQNAWVNGEAKIVGQYTIQIRDCMDCAIREFRKAYEGT